MTVDIVIVGAGPAGLTVDLLAERHGLETVLLERGTIGGELVNRHRIEEFPGISPDTPGTELRERMAEQLEDHDPDIRLTEVTAVEPDTPAVVRTADDTEYRARCVLLATGGTQKRLSVPGEAEYEGRGVFYCAKCDGPLYRDEHIAVAGGGDWVMTDAIYLSEFAESVTVIERDAGGRETRHQREDDHPAIDVVERTRIEEIVGRETLERLVLRDEESGERRTISVDGLLVQAGTDPNTEYLDGRVPTDGAGRIEVDSGMETEVPGIFAAGDVRQNSSERIAGAIGDGTTAFHSMRRHLDGTSVE